MTRHAPTMPQEAPAVPERDCVHLDACRRLALFPLKRWGFAAEWMGCREGCGLYQNKVVGT